MSDSQTRQIRQTIGMLNSMIKSGESHSPTSEKMIELSNKALDGVEQRLGAGQVDAIVSLLVERVRELEDEIESLKLSGNPQDWKKAAAQKLVVMGFLEAKAVIQHEAN